MWNVETLPPYRHFILLPFCYSCHILHLHILKTSLNSVVFFSLKPCSMFKEPWENNSFFFFIYHFCCIFTIYDVPGFQYHFFHVWKTLLISCFRSVLLAMNSLSLPSPESIFNSPHSSSIFLFDTEIWVDSAFPSRLKMFHCFLDTMVSDV